MNLYLHDIEDARIRRGDTLRDPKFLDAVGHLQRFDVVIANPPFSLRNWGVDVWSRDPFGRAIWGVPPASSADFAWVQHMVTSMKPITGRVGVVMPHGVLFRPRQEKVIRRAMIESGLLDSVVGLPPKLFYNTIIRASLLIFRATPRDRGHILMVDASRAYEKAKQNYLREHHIELIARAVKDPDSADAPVVARWVTANEVVERDWSLALSRYLDTPTESEWDPQLALEGLAEAAAATDLARAQLHRALAELGLESSVDG
jgi:type I restriction enzyme M protein